MPEANQPTHIHLLDDGWDVVVRTATASIHGPIEILSGTDVK